MDDYSSRSLGYYSFTYGHRLAYTVSDMLLSGQIPGDLSSSESYDDDGTAEVDIESQYMDKLERRQAYIEKGANSHLAQALALQGTPKAPVESPTTQPTVDPAAANKTDTSA